ncbi:spore coat protein YlbD [Pueribacillus theae]|uniref:spore coat protein YlbD n=1 Tax=Pueribacillus theae TaxID=2171751 RepID=UPI0014030FE3|nr:spore coat protein YlbD [Pueribacillus theae]
MSQQSVESFKKFVKKHPSLIKEVRNGRRNWKELYEEWYILGEQDEVWDVYKEKEGGNSSSDERLGFFGKLRQVDFDQVQKNISDMKGLVGNIQELIRDFKPKQKPPTAPRMMYQSPFTYNRPRR